MQNRAARKSFDQPSLFGEDQPDLFGGVLPRSDVYVPDPEHVRSGARGALEKLQALDSWASVGPGARGRLFRSVGYYYRITADDAEAEEWRRRYEAEMARLDAAGPREPPGERENYHNYVADYEAEWTRRPPGRLLNTRTAP